MFENLKKYSSKILTFVFTGAESDYEVEWSGERIWIDSATSDFTVKINDRSNDAYPMKAKKSILAPYDRFFISVTGANTIVIHVSDPAEIAFAGNEINVDSIEGLEKTTSMTVKQVLVDDTAGGTLLLASNPNRKEARFKIKPGDSDVFVGETGLTVNDGFLIEDGGAEVFSKFTGAWYGITTALGSATVYVIAEG